MGNLITGSGNRFFIAKIAFSIVKILYENDSTSKIAMWEKLIE